VPAPRDSHPPVDACAEPLPPRATEAIRLFNSGEYYRQHDLLEALWRDEPRRVRDLYQGILQVGVAYYQVTQGNRRGAVKMLMRAERWLAPLPDVCQTVDVAALRADADRVKAALLALSDAEIGRFDRGLFAPVRVV
jgi:uncharacterized protein